MEDWQMPEVPSLSTRKGKVQPRKPQITRKPIQTRKPIKIN